MIGRIGGGRILIPDFTADGKLPVGRFQCDLLEVKAILVDAPHFAASSRRTSLWDDFQAATMALSACGCAIPAALLGGSFVTDKIDPDDVDVIFMIDHDSIDDQQRARVQAVAQQIGSATNIQAMVMFWRPVEDSHTTWSSPDQTYLLLRGKWDDWWQRDVPKLLRSTFQRSHSFPRRGYLEVVLDGYH